MAGLVDRQDSFPEVDSDSTLAEIRVLVDEGISWLREVSTILELLYLRRSGGFFSDPLDELAARVLGTSMDEESSRRTVTVIREVFSSWDAVLEARANEIRRESGTDLPSEAVRGLKSLLRGIRASLDECSLDSLKEWECDKVEEFLTSLPGVSTETAYSVMAATLGMQVFAADKEQMRVLTRMGPYRELGLDLQKLSARKRKKLAETFLPPVLRGIYQLALPEHARTKCHVRQPECASCEIRNFCTYYRNNRIRSVQRQKELTFLDVFCGAGGMSSGFVREGYRPLLAVDSDPSAMRTYAFNHPQVPDTNVLCEDIRGLSASRIRKLTGLRRPDVIIGSPPCQGFSATRKFSGGEASNFHSNAENTRARRESKRYEAAEDERNFLFQHMIRITLELRPRLFLMENVPGMKSTRLGHLSFFDSARDLLEEGGYATDVWKLHAASFGVPQDRIRLFLIAAYRVPLPHKPEHEYVDSLNNSYDYYQLPQVTFDEATYDLPPLEANSGAAILKIKNDRDNGSRYKRYLKKFGIANESELIFNHRARYNNEKDLELYDLLKPGENSVHAIERYGRRDLMRYRQDVHDDKYLRLRANRPCRTILSHLAKDGNGYIHPTQKRSITVREAARIQSFSDDFVFCGPPRDQWKQVGNAVPPVLATAIAGAFKASL